MFSRERSSSQEKFTCPRRGEDLGRILETNQDSFDTGHELVSQARGCTYCGSMPPNDFMDAIAKGAEISPTDKSYKAYVQLERGKSKFYFQHLSETQRAEFVRLLNAKKLKFGYPGHFYVLPYFISVRTAKEGN